MFFNAAIITSRRDIVDSGPDYYTFDGIASYMTTDFDMNGIYNMTLVFDQIILDKAGGGGSPTVSLTGRNTFAGYSYDTGTWFLREDSQGNLDVQLVFSGLSSNGSLTYTIDRNNYHRYALTYDGTSIRIYEDGVLKDTTADADFLGFTASTMLRIGRRGTTLTEDAMVKMRRLQVYNRALSASELLDLETDITSVTSGKVADFGKQKNSTTWTDDVSGKVATIVGGVALGELGTELYASASAATYSGAENDQATGFTDAAYTTITAPSGDVPPNGGTYAVKIEANAAESYVRAIVEYPVTSGKTYRIRAMIKEVVAVNAPAMQMNETGGLFGSNLVVPIADAGWNGYVLQNIATGTGTAELHFYISGATAATIGDYILVDRLSIEEIGTDLFPADNAASIPAVNSTGSWVNQGSGTMEIETTDTNGKGYAMKQVSSDGAFDRITIDFSVVGGTQYRIAGDYKAVIGTDQQLKFIGFDENPYLIPSASWSSFNETVTATSTGTATIQIEVTGGGGNIGDTNLINNISIVEL